MQLDSRPTIKLEVDNLKSIRKKAEPTGSRHMRRE
jgi:hypothetical protein